MPQCKFSLARTKPETISRDLLNEIMQIGYSLYQKKHLTKIIYNEKFIIPIKTVNGYNLYEHKTIVEQKSLMYLNLISQVKQILGLLLSTYQFQI